MTKVISKREREREFIGAECFHRGRSPSLQRSIEASIRLGRWSRRRGLTSWIRSTKQIKGTKSGWRLLNTKAIPSDRLLPVRLHSLNLPPEYCLLGVVFKCLRLWGTFLSQNTTLCISERQKWILESWSKCPQELSRKKVNKTNKLGVFQVSWVLKVRSPFSTWVC